MAAVNRIVLPLIVFSRRVPFPFGRAAKDNQRRFYWSLRAVNIEWAVRWRFLETAIRLNINVPPDQETSAVPRLTDMLLPSPTCVTFP